jgi:hypothetical protein
VVDSPGEWRRGCPRRRLLLEAYQAMAGTDADARLSILTAFAAGRGIPCMSHGAILRDTPSRLAVRIAHALELAPAGLQYWQASWPMSINQQPGEHLALLAAQLLSHRDELALLVAPLPAAASDADAGGALVDSGTCARVAVAGYDVDSELLLGNPLLLLEAAGDLLHAGDGSAEIPGATLKTDMNYLLLGLKWHAAAAD